MLHHRMSFLIKSMSGVLFTTFKVAEYERLSQRKPLCGFFDYSSLLFNGNIISGSMYCSFNSKSDSDERPAGYPHK